MRSVVGAKPGKIVHLNAHDAEGKVVLDETGEMFSKMELSETAIRDATVLIEASISG
jgi:hypothetical protein